MRKHTAFSLALIASCVLMATGCMKTGTSGTDMQPNADMAGGGGGGGDMHVGGGGNDMRIGGGGSDLRSGGSGDMRGGGGGGDLRMQNNPDMQMGASDMKLTGVSVPVHVGAGGQAAYSPQAVTINVGDKVHWIWDNGNHNVVSGNQFGDPDNLYCSPNDINCDNPPPSDAGATYDHAFTTPGTYYYFSTIENDYFNGMVGCIAVGAGNLCQF